MGCLKLQYNNVHKPFFMKVENNVQWFMSVDPMAGKFPWMSPYSYAEGNPIWKLDKGGDSTIYYTQSGVMLWATADKLDNAITIIPDKNLVKFQIWKEASIKHNVPDNDVIASNLRQFGTTYNVKATKEWIENNKIPHIFEKEDVPENPELIGKKSPLFDEVGAVLDMKNGMFVPGEESMWMGSVQYHQNKPSDGSSYIHTHLNEGYPKLGVNPGAIKTYSPDVPGSLDAMPKEGFLNIVGTRNALKFYGKGTDNITITNSSFKNAVKERSRTLVTPSE